MTQRRDRLSIVPLTLDYEAANESGGSRLKRAVISAAAWSLLGGSFAAAALWVLHPHPLEALPAAPIMLICLARGGGDWDAILFILAGGFVLYGIYGFVTMFPKSMRRRIVNAAICAAIHLLAALLCEMKRLGQL